MMNIPSECMINNFNPNHAMILKECGQKLWVRAGHPGVEEPDHRHRRLLPSRRKRPRSRRATEKRDEIASFHSITSSASVSRLSEILSPSVFAVFKLITSSNLVG